MTWCGQTKIPIIQHGHWIQSLSKTKCPKCVVGKCSCSIAYVDFSFGLFAKWCHQEHVVSMLCFSTMHCQYSVFAQRPKYLSSQWGWACSDALPLTPVHSALPAHALVPCVQLIKQSFQCASSFDHSKNGANLL